MKNRLTLRNLACPVLGLLLACSPSGTTSSEAPPHHGANDISEDVKRIESAGKLARNDPAQALRTCHAVSDITLQRECITSMAPHLARKAPDDAIAACASITPSEECFFRIAEAIRSPELCERAGQQEDNCRLHILSFNLKNWIFQNQSFELIAENADPQIREAGLEPSDPRPWIAIWRWALSQNAPLNREACTTVQNATSQEACFQSGRDLFHDRLNRARDQGHDLCHGPLPDTLSHTEDSELDTILEQRRATDLCDPSARRTAPSGPLPGSAQ